MHGKRWKRLGNRREADRDLRRLYSIARATVSSRMRVCARKPLRIADGVYLEKTGRLVRKGAAADFADEAVLSAASLGGHAPLRRAGRAYLRDERIAPLAVEDGSALGGLRVRGSRGSIR